MVSHLAELPGVADTVDDARAAVDRLLSHRVVRRRSAGVSAESVLHGARASAALEGVDLPLERIRAGATGSPIATGAIRVCAELGTFTMTWRQAPRQVLARLHVLAAADLVPAERLGRPRVDLDAEDPLELGEPPAPEDVSIRLDALAGLVTGDRSAPAVIVAAIAHAELLALRPFGSADGIVARAAERLVLISRGLDPKSLVTPETGHWELREHYHAAARGYSEGGTEGVAAWIRHCADAITLGARESTAICEALQR